MKALMRTILVCVVAAVGSMYTFMSACEFGGQQIESTSVMTAESTTAYSDAIESHGGGKHTQESLSAKRIGDC